MYTQDEETLIQKAVAYLSEHISKSGHNPKPVILHSIRVAMYLYRQKAPVSVIVAAFLHDLVEDSAVTPEDIRKDFGDEVTTLVKANSFKSEIANNTKRYLETFKRNLESGVNAALIKGADILDNADYYHLTKPSMQKKLYTKLTRFIRLSQPVIGDSQVWQDLKEKETKLRKNLSL